MFVYVAGSEMMILLLYVDDIILTGSSESFIYHLISYLSAAFTMKDLGDLHFFLGLEATRSIDSILLTQRKYTLELLDKEKMLECNPCSTPVAKGPRYLCLTRPDICFAVNYVSQYMHAPTDVYLLLVKRILRYLKGSIGLGITMRKGDITTLTAYTDSDRGNCPETARSTSGYAIFLGSSLISWSSKKQPTVSRYTAEAEYKGLSVATAELEWLSSILSELHIALAKPITLYCDNTSVIYLSANPISRSREKHIKIHYHVVRELITSGFLPAQHIAS
ncbi:uncharacterized protein LOC113312925 [Papaver somniferum]|uniref:uncharacterized protein LOC113312925 n=1 Tax=Papaver somniferum TaxID=3469 RepID=UPI000E701D51|nr:uncharacterized protein LOC113312925 [Papaver somniferum]